MEIDAEQLDGIFESGAEIVAGRNLEVSDKKRETAIWKGWRLIVGNWALQNGEPDNPENTKKRPNRGASDGFGFESAWPEHAALGLQSRHVERKLFLRFCHIRAGRPEGANSFIRVTAGFLRLQKGQETLARVDMESLAIGRQGKRQRHLCSPARLAFDPG